MLAAMRAAELAEQNCSIARPAALLGDRWTLVILRQAFNGTKRFEDFRREPYKDEVRTRDRYRLTEMGLDLYPVLMALREWGDRYLAEDGPPLEVRHRDCGGEPTLELRCSKCGEEVGARDAEAFPGPGIRAAA